MRSRCTRRASGHSSSTRTLAASSGDWGSNLSGGGGYDAWQRFFEDALAGDRCGGVPAIPRLHRPPRQGAVPRAPRVRRLPASLALPAWPGGSSWLRGQSQAVPDAAARALAAGLCSLAIFALIGSGCGGILGNEVLADAHVHGVAHTYAERDANANGDRNTNSHSDTGAAREPGRAAALGYVPVSYCIVTADGGYVDGDVFVCFDRAGFRRVGCADHQHRRLRHGDGRG